MAGVFLKNVGDVVGNFTILKVLPNRGRHGNRIFEIRCNPCGKILERNSSDILKQKSCGCLWSFEDRSLSVASARYGNLKERQKKYKGVFISFDYFLILSRSNCYYCGIEPSNKSKDQRGDFVWYYSGIDRIDSKYGYVDGNVRSCCKKCNVAKLDSSEEEFLNHIKRIYNHSILNS